MADDRDTVLNKLHLLQETSVLTGGPNVQVVLSTNQGQLVPFLATTTVWEQHNYLTCHNDAHTEWLKDNTTNEAYKNLIIQIVDKVYLSSFYNKRFGNKGKTIREFLDLLIEKNQTTPEESAAVKVQVDQPWDINEYIITFFDRLKKQLTILAKMKNTVPYPERDFVEALYMALQKKRSNFPKLVQKGRRRMMTIVRTKTKQETTSMIFMMCMMNKKILFVIYALPTMMK